jgi:translocation and assembly module TamB
MEVARRACADVNAAGEPLPGKSAPPLELALRGKGDLQSFTIESVNATLPGIASRLSEPVTIERSGKIRESAAHFAIQADLAKIPWFSAGGAISGEARLVSGFAASPVVEFSFDARDVNAQDVALSAVNARGRLNWPELQISDGSIVGGEGERLTWRGGWNFGTKELLETAVDGQIRRQSLARWLPKQPEFDVVKIRAHASGPLAAMTHGGTADAEGVKANGISALHVSAEWQGRGAAIEEFKTEATTGGSKIVAGGSLDASALKLTMLDFIQANSPLLQLTSPATIRWRPQLQLETLRLAGPEGSLTASATSGEKGRIEIAAQNVSSKWFSDFVALPGPAWTVTLLALVGSWDRGPMTFSLTAGAGLEIGAGRTAAVNMSARGDKEGVRIEALRATEANATVIEATGRVPVVFTPGASSLLHMDVNGALVLDATVAPNADFWQQLSAISGVELKEPRASAHLKGTWQKPEGSASLQATKIAIDPKRIARPLPTIELLDIQLTGDRGGVTLRKFSVNVEGQAVRAEGRLPVPDGQWTVLFKQPLETARRGGDLRLEIPDAEVAVFTRFLPAVLAPKGRLQVDVHYKSGGLEGFLRLRDAASRPLGPLGVLQEISADIAMSGRKFALRGVTAKSGGQPVTLNGIVEWPENGVPQFDVALRGENLPFVRQTGLLLRGDLDLKLQTPANGPPRLSGSLKLRDSLFLSDIRAFLPKGGASASRRPPYFSIDTPPINTWTLAVDVVGEEFLRLRTPVFTGVASAHFRLGGTLGEPRAIGEITIEEGNVRMPFASFSVTQGSVRLTEADPYEPTIYLRGTGRRYGYDLTMEIDGGASQPNVVFMSSPPLDSEQVLLMVMTGAAPSNEINKSATQRVANIGIFLSQSLLGSIGADASEADRVSFATGEKISRQGKETYEIEYKLSDRWTLTGEYNEYDERNVGVKWRVFRGKRAGEDSDNAKKENAKK